MSSVALSISLNPATHAISLSTSRAPSFDALVSIAQQRFSLPIAPTSLTYVDDEGDMITISTDQELAELLADADFEPVKLTVGGSDIRENAASPTPEQDRDHGALLTSIQEALKLDPTLADTILDVVQEQSHRRYSSYRTGPGRHGHRHPHRNHGHGRRPQPMGTDTSCSEQDEPQHKHQHGRPGHKNHGSPHFPPPPPQHGPHNHHHDNHPMYHCHPPPPPPPHLGFCCPPPPPPPFMSPGPPGPRAFFHTTPPQYMQHGCCGNRPESAGCEHGGRRERGFKHDDRERAYGLGECGSKYNRHM